MKTTYIETAVKSTAEQQDILIALLSEVGYEAFEDKEGILKAYIQKDLFDQDQIEAFISPLGLNKEDIQHTDLPATNWNAVWEAEYQSVEVGMFCQIVPSHREPKPDFAHTIRLDPKMAFGTGHHQTTRLMIRNMAELNFEGKRVLDMGCGTGVLGILAKMMGSEHVIAIDIDKWSEENTLENARLNGVSGMEIVHGDVTAIPNEHYDIILANINRNVLLADIPAYTKHLIPNGTLLLSGIYQQDVEMIVEKAEEAHLSMEGMIEEDDWVSLKLVNEADRL
ncbi:MAG: 50S ribosomal protein L11 methyltransferase [Bacteroidota bacterium]